MGFYIRTTITSYIEVFLCRISINWVLVICLWINFLFPIDLESENCLIKAEHAVETRFKSVPITWDRVTTGKEEINNRSIVESGSASSKRRWDFVCVRLSLRPNSMYRYFALLSSPPVCLEQFIGLNNRWLVWILGLNNYGMYQLYADE